MSVDAAALAAYDQQQAALREEMIASLVAVWAQMSGTVIAAPAFIAQVLPVSLGSQRTMAALTNAYLRRALGEPPRPINLTQVTGPPLRGGKPADIVYARPIATMRRALADGKSVHQARTMGLRRLTDIASADLQLSKTHTARQVMTEAAQGRQDVVGFRRVLSGNGNHCAMCVLASTQRYNSFDLMPMHPNCQCSVAPIVGSEDPGRVLDPATARQVHEIVRRDLGEKYANASGVNYRDIVIVNDHGELGPVLGVRGQFFTGPDGVRRLTHDKISDQLEDTPNVSDQ